MTQKQHSRVSKSHRGTHDRTGGVCIALQRSVRPRRLPHVSLFSLPSYLLRVCCVVVCAGIPQSMVFRRGKVGAHVSDLVEDLRRVMSPYTAKQLKESKKNTLKDFVAVASPLGVTHFMILSQTAAGSNLRLVRLPHGPTFTFRLSAYSNIRDIVQMQKTPHSPGSEYSQPPLLVLNNFSAAALQAAAQAAQDEDAAEREARELDRENNPTATLIPPSAATLKLTATMFQNMFPPIDIAKLQVKECRRVVILQYEPRTSQVFLRHYLITAAPIGLNKSVKKLLKSQLPDLGSLQDISEFVTKESFVRGLSDSEAEDAPDAKITLPQNYHGRGNRASNKSAIRLQELGPRLDMQLMKVSEEMDGGKVLYHYRNALTEAEVLAMEKRARARKEEKARRKAEQARNVEKKAAGTKRKRGDPASAEDEGAERLEADPTAVVNAAYEAVDMSAPAESGGLGVPRARKADGRDVEDDDAAWYRREVGQEPQEGLFDDKGDKASKSFPLKAEQRAEAAARRREERMAKGGDDEDDDEAPTPRKKQKVEGGGGKARGGGGGKSNGGGAGDRRSSGGKRESGSFGKGGRGGSRGGASSRGRSSSKSREGRGGRGGQN